MSNNINLIITLIRHAQAFVFGQLRFQQFFAYRCNNIFHLPSFYFFIFNVQLTIYTRYLSHIVPTLPEFSTYRMFATEWVFRK